MNNKDNNFIDSRELSPQPAKPMSVSLTTSIIAGWIVYIPQGVLLFFALYSNEFYSEVGYYWGLFINTFINFGHIAFMIWLTFFVIKTNKKYLMFLPLFFSIIFPLSFVVLLIVLMLIIPLTVILLLIFLFKILIFLSKKSINQKSK